MSDLPAQNPVQAPRCSSTTKAGEACKGYAVDGHSTCVSHTPDLAKRAQEAASQASAVARRQRVEKRKEDSESAKLSLTQAIQRDAAAKRDEIAKSLVAAAISDGSSAAMRELLNRVEGKVADIQRTEAGESLEAFTTAELQAWLHSAKAESESL